MYSFLRFLLVLLVFLQIGTANAHQEKSKGTVIVLYGTSCSGKSTLARELQSELPGDFLIVKRRPLVEEKKRRLIESVTGTRPKTDEETREAMMNLPTEYRKEGWRMHHQGFEETVVVIRQLLDQGANLIFDACIQHKDLKHFKGYQPLTVLVYAPPEELWRRYEKRTANRRISTEVRARKKTALLNSFSKHYKHANSQSHKSRKVITREGMLQLGKAEGDSRHNPRIASEKEKALEHFGLNSQDEAEIIPAADADLFIDTTASTTEESLDLIKNALKYR